MIFMVKFYAIGRAGSPFRINATPLVVFHHEQCQLPAHLQILERHSMFGVILMLISGLRFDSII